VPFQNRLSPQAVNEFKDKKEKENDRIEDLFDGCGSAVAAAALEFHCMTRDPKIEHAPQGAREKRSLARANWPQPNVLPPEEIPWRGPWRWRLCLPATAGGIEHRGSAQRNGGVRVSQISGTLPGTLYAGRAFCYSDGREHLRPSTCAITCLRRACGGGRKDSGPERRPHVQSLERLNIAPGSCTVRYRLDPNKLDSVAGRTCRSGG